MCWHKWGKWGNLIEEEWATQAYIHGIKVGTPREYIKMAQTRTCEKCGKIQRKHI